MRTNVVTRGVQLAALLAVAALAGCGDPGGLPVGVSPEAAPPAIAQASTETGSPVGRIVFGGPAPHKARKLAAELLQVKTVTELLDIDEDEQVALVVNEPGTFQRTAGTVHVLEVELGIYRNSIGGDPAQGLDVVPITLTATSGAALEDVSVSFSPSGLTFEPAARLVLTLTGSRPDRIYAYHISADGTVTQIDVTIVSSGNEWKVIVPVPGFSQYTWDDGGDP